MKKFTGLWLLFLVFLVCISWGTVATADVVDSYSEENIAIYLAIQASQPGMAQAFTASSNFTLDSCKFYMKLGGGAPTGSMYVKIYSHSGTYGTSSLPNDSLCVSAAFDVSTLTSTPGLVTFIFSGDNRISLGGEPYYCTAVEYSGGNLENYIVVGGDGTSPTHDGNAAYKPSGWVVYDDMDVCFYVYGEAEAASDTCCDVSDASLAFGDVNINTGVYDTLYVTNCHADSTLTAAPRLADSTQYWVSWVSEGWGEWTLDPGEICSLQITFHPLSVGEKLDTLSWTQDGCDIVPFSGMGVVPSPCCDESQGSFAFGNVEVYYETMDTLYITNCDADCTLTCAPLLADSTEYTITWCSKGEGEWTLDPAEICSIEVMFFPQDVGAEFDTLTFTQDSCDAIYISGTGYTPSEYPSGDNIYYLAPPHPASGLRAGNDGYAGNHPDTAWATLQYAKSQTLGADDTLFIMGGVYTNAQYFEDGAGIIYGTEGSPLVFKAYGDSIAVFTSTGPHENGYYYRTYFHFYTYGNDYIVIDGFSHIDSADSFYIKLEGHEDTQALIKFLGGPDHYHDGIVVRGVELDGEHATGEDDVDTGIYLRYCRYSTFEDNYIHHIHHPTGSISPGDNTDELQGSGSGMYLFSCELVTVNNNIIKYCNHGSIEVEIYRPSGHASRYCKFTNNIIENHYGGGIYLTINAHHNLIEGNVITHCGETTTHPKSAILLSGSNNTIRNNVFHNPTRSGLVMAGQSVIGYNYIVENNNIYNNTSFGCGRSLNIVVKNTANPDCRVEDNILVNNIFYLSDYWNADGRRPEISIDVYQANLDHNWCDPDVAACVPHGTHWGGNVFHNNCIRRNSDGSAYDTLVVWGRDADCGGGFTDWSLDSLEAADATAWNNNIGTNPLLVSESPDAYGINSGWWYLQVGSPCIDAGSNVTDTIGTYVEGLYPGYGWDVLSYNGEAFDIGAWESGGIEDTCCSMTPGSIAFGDIFVDLAEVDTVYITNCGADSLTVTPHLVDSTQFWVTWVSKGWGSFGLDSAETCSLEVTFAPLSIGNKYDTLSWDEDACTMVYLSGAGVYPTECCNVSPSYLDFGNISVDASLVDTLFVANCDPDCTLTATPLLDDSTQFWVTWVSEGWNQWTLDPGEVCSLEITFCPLSAGPHDDTLSWLQDSCSIVVMGGVGLYPAVFARSPDGTIEFPVDGPLENRIDAGDTCNRSVLIWNAGTPPSEGLTLDLYENFTYWDIAQGAAPCTLLAGETLAVEFTYQPSGVALGNWSNVDIATGWVSDEVDSINVRGVTWFEYDCTLTEDSLWFDTTTVRQADTLSLYVVNTSSSDYTDTLITVITEDCARYSVLSGSGEQHLWKDDSLLVEVRFRPTAVGDYPCTLYTNDECDSCLTLPMFGVGVAGEGGVRVHQLHWYDKLYKYFLRMAQ